jgi:hypothetical protein
MNTFSKGDETFVYLYRNHALLYLETKQPIKKKKK